MGRESEVCVTIDREGLKRWYREAMHRRLTELRALRRGLRAGEADARDAARAVAQALRGSGATYGYPELSTAAGLVESASNPALARHVEGLIEHLRGIAGGEAGGSAGVGAEWLVLAAGGSDEDAEQVGFADIATAWERAAARGDVGQDELERRVAEMFDLRVADLSSPSRAALRLVPEALIHSEPLLPLREDVETVTVATSDPTSLEAEDQILRMTGRTPLFAVASPGRLREGIAQVLDPEPVEDAGRAEDRPTTSPPAARPPQPENAREDRILLVDDDPAALVLARSVLEKGGYGVEEAGDGREALERLEADASISLVVADLNMPRLDGLELLWEMRARDDWSGIPMIVVTGETDEILETKLIEEGADDYICKPLDARLFLARVAATIRRSEH